ncbi:zinc finger protein-domain-containing protein [Fusarium avenaceum]|nr:zinc finger protein-domain-containing protein [Fusarium avenaceum]
MANQKSMAQLLSLGTAQPILEGPSQDRGLNDYQKIRFGQCGLIFHKNGVETVIKVARPFFQDSLYADSLAHRAVQAAFDKQPEAPICRLPKFHSYHEETILISEYIPPLPQIVREALIERYCPKVKYEDALKDPLNHHCLARVYLGRRRAPNQPLQTNFTLRNFNLHLDQMIEMQLPVVKYAEAIGEALAVLHWGACIDAYDVEFVLGSEVLSKAEATIRIWVLDFNLCSLFDEEVAIGYPTRVIDQLVDSFFENDPYYPRPGSNGEMEGQLWDTFKAAYILKAEAVLSMSNSHATLLHLPHKFIEACIDRGAKSLSTSHET